MDGADAFVTCRCWVEGRTGDPPVPRELIDDSDSSSLAIVSSVEGERAELSRRLRAWVDEEACPHESMCAHYEWVGTWAGIELFGWAVETFGAARLPVLSSLSIGSPTQQVSPAESRLALAELDLLGGCREYGSRDALYDEATGACLLEANWHLRRSVPGMVEARLGFDADGMYAGRRPDPVVRLGRRIRQERTGDGWQLVPDDPGVPGGGRDTAPVPIPVPVLDGAAVVVQRPCTYGPQHISWEVASLREAFGTAVEVGSPVHWAF